MKKTVLLLVMLCSLSMLMAQGTTPITGSVVDKAGNPIVGASVVIKGTTTGVTTDFDGNFNLPSVGKEQTLIFSYIGFKSQEVAVNDRTDFKITLADDTDVLDEVVVVGYGTQKKATLTGAVASVSGDNLIKRSVATLSTAIQGTMPGVIAQQVSGEPGADGATIRIRGIGSINSSTDPLVLVDGIEMDINQVDMSVVENVSVLKDAASASIYGSRASNGVILITTKRGKEGKVQVSYSGYVAAQKPTNLPEPVSAADYLQAELNSWDNAGSVVTPEVREARLKLIEEQRTLRPDNWNRYDTDWKKATLSSSAPMHNHNVTMTGGNKDLRFLGAVSYLHQDGLIANNSYSRLNIRVNADANITSWIRLSSELALRQSNQVLPSVATPKSIINKSLYMLPTLSAARELDGNWGYGKNGDNPTAQAEAGGTQQWKKPEQLATGTLFITPLKNLELQAQYSNRKYNERTTTIVTPYQVSLRGQVMGFYPAQDGVTERWLETVRNYYRTQASYSIDAGHHQVKALVGFEAEDNLTTDFNAAKRGFNMDRYYLNNGDGATASAGGGASSWSMMSYYGRFNYNYKEKYLLESSVRYDGSSRFIPSERWGLFPSGSVGWVVSKESFMESINHIVNQLKLRGSYGLLGNQNLSLNSNAQRFYPYAATVDAGYNYWFDKNLSSGVAQVALANPNVTWEKSQQINFGVDASLWNQKLGVIFDYYVKDVYDMLMTFPLPYYAGMKPAVSNAGDMRNQGWEISLTHRNTIGEFNYGVTINLADNKSKITNLNGQTFTDLSMQVGYPNGGLWGFLTDGYLQDEEDVKNSPKVSTAGRPGFVKYKKVYQGEDTNPLLLENRDKVYLGDPFPHYEYGLNLTGSWKNIDLTVFIQGVAQRKVMMSGIGLRPFVNGANLFSHQMDSWTPDNRNAAYPILLPEFNSPDNFVTSDKWVRSGAYTRLKNVVIGYTLPKSALSKFKISNARFYLSGQNLFTISGFYKGYDPEVNYGGTNGGEFYPIMQTFTFGIDLKF